MVTYLLRRCLLAIPVLLIASTLVFGALRALPGDPVDALYPPTAAVSPAARSLLRSQLGFDQPLPIQYISWLTHALQGDLGVSLRQKRPVIQLIAQRGPLTLGMVVLSTLLALAIALPLGVLAAVRRGTPTDRLASIVALAGLSIPGFALGTLLALVFGVWMHVVPTVGSLVLPVVTQAVAAAGILVRTVRSGVLDELNRDYVRTARGKGLNSLASIVVHVLPNALPVTISVLTTVVGYELGGAVVIEQVFGWPGLGSLLFDSVAGRDFAVVQGVTLVAVSAYVLVNLAGDLARAALNPRLR